MRRASTFAALLTLAAIGCKTDSDGIASVLVVASVEVTPGTAEVPLGSNLQLTAHPKTATGMQVPGRDIIWASEASAIVQVTEEGVARGLDLGGPVRITATVEGVTGEALITATGEGFKLGLVTQPPSSAASGATFSRAPAIELRTSSGGQFKRAGVAVTVALLTGDGTLGGTRTVSTDANGRATFPGLAITGKVGSYTLSFDAPLFSGVTSSAITLTPGAAARLGIVTQPSPTAIAGEKLERQPVIQILDASGNAVPTGGVTVTAGLQPGLGSLGGDRTKSTSGSGAAAFSDLKITGIGSYTLVFTVPGLVSVVSNSIAVAP